MPTQQGTLIFLHSFKTAGTTLRHIMAKQYPAHACYYFYRSQKPTPLEALTFDERACIRLCASHEPFGTHDGYLTPPIHYITLLRDPVDRVISEYRYRRHKGLQGAQGDLPLLAVSEQMRQGRHDNLQVRMLSGQGRVGEVTAATLEQACTHLLASSMTFGLVEHFVESLLLFRATFGWQALPVGLAFNRTPRQGAPPVDRQTRRALAEHHPFDVQLVNMAREHFARRLHEAGITPTEVAKFPNSWATRAHIVSFLSTLTVKRSWRMLKRALKRAR